MAAKKITPRFTAQSTIVLPGSEKTPVTGVPTLPTVGAGQPRPTGAGAPRPTGVKPAPPAARLTVSVVVKRKNPLTANQRQGKQRVTHAEYRRTHASDPESVKLVRAFAKEFGLTVAPDTPGPERRTIKLSGSVAAMQKAFGVQLDHTTIGGETYRIREGSIHIPEELAGHVLAVLGLDNRPQAEPHFRVAGQHGAIAAAAAQAGGFARPHAADPLVNTSFTPVQIADLYQFPKPLDATGQTIGIIELGGGFRTTDLNNYFKSLGQKTPQVIAVSIDGAKNSPSTASSADGEVMLDIEVAAAVAPGARIVVYFAPNTDQGFIDSIAHAVHDITYKPSVISISWGAAEVNWTQQAMTALDAACQSAAALGITITVAAGDNGSTDGVPGGANHVDFPASSPHVLACGGTKLQGNGGAISSEVVWNELSANEGATGGGVSNVFPLPTWQASAKVPKPTVATGGRGVPDVAGNADPTTGYSILVDGLKQTIGGTSAVAPLWAGLIAVINKVNGKSAGFLNPAIYAAKAKPGFRDITQGTNFVGTPVGFTAGTGWDACTGLGSPIGTKLVSALKPSTPTKKTAAKTAKKAVKTAAKPVRKTASKPARKQSVR